MMRRIGCCALLLFVAACARAPMREPAPAAALPREVLPPSAVAVPQQPEPSETSPAPVAPPPAPPPDVWHRLRQGLRFAACDGATSDYRRRLVDPARVAAQLQAHAALIEFILRELAVHDLPTEFALLPMVESDYRALRTQGNRPAGMWQFMPITAREYRMPVGTDYDARVDLTQSTRAAARYLADLGARFDGDWILANMAFNAGEYRVKRALRAHPQRPIDYARLPLRGITRAHTARLIALSCLVAEPKRFGVDFAPPDTPRLRTLTLKHDLDLALAALLSGVPYSDLRGWNPGSARGTQPAGTALLLPGAGRAALRAALRDWPRERRVGWTAWRANGSLDWQALAQGSTYDGATLAQLHGSDIPAPRTGSMVALPPGSAHAARAGAILTSVDGHYVVRTGDSLWLIARRHGVRMADLMQWNRLSRTAVLRPGQRLRVAAP
jgi:membrane-bound lytic murein transglycosylase D